MRFFGIGGGRGGPRTISPEQLKNNETVEQEKVDAVLAKQNARYDAMTEEEREKYYLKPTLRNRFKKALRGGQ